MEQGVNRPGDPTGAPQATAKVSGTDLVPKNPLSHKDLQGEESIHCSGLTESYFILFSSEPEMSGLIADSLFHDECTVIGQGNERKCHL